MFTAPAVQHGHGTRRSFVATGGGTAAYALRGGRLHALWQNATAGTSPIVAGGAALGLRPARRRSTSTGRQRDA